MATTPTLTAGLAIAGLILTGVPTASAAATDLTATAKQDFGWRNLAWTVTSAKPLRDADILHVAANDWGVLVGRPGGGGIFRLTVPKKCTKLRVRTKVNGVDVSDDLPPNRIRTLLVRQGRHPARVGPVTHEVKDGNWREPDVVGRPAPGSRQFTFRIKDKTASKGEAGYVMGLTFGGYCPRNALG